MVDTTARTVYTEQYANTSPRVLAAVVTGVTLLVALDVVIQFRTWAGLLVLVVMAAIIMFSYLMLWRPMVLLGPQNLLIRNHIRDHVIPWSRVSEVEMKDVLRIQVDGRWVRAPAVQLILKDLRREYSARRPAPTGRELPGAYSQMVMERLEAHVDQYRDESPGEPAVRWRVVELTVFGLLLVGAAVGMLLLLR